MEINNPIVDAVAPLKNDAIERAEQEANKVVENVRKALAEVNNDMELVAPYPKSFNTTKAQYMVELSKYRLFSMLVKSRKGSRSPHEPKFVDVDETRVAKFIENAKHDAAAQYDAFVRKLVNKIGDTTEAKLTGNHVWGESFLYVTLPDGTKQKWKTQQIVNRSKLGTLFNQWPSRKVK